MLDFSIIFWRNEEILLKSKEIMEDRFIVEFEIQMLCIYT